MRAIVFEGDPREVAEALRNLGVTAQSVPAILPNEPEGTIEEAEDSGEAWSFVSTPVARRVLSRRQLQDLPKQMLALIYNAGDAGILGNVLAKKLGYSAAQFRGMMGAFGRRLSNTPGYDGHAHFFGWEWNYEKGTYRYWLPETVREAVRIEVIEKRG
jgi:hypothetical protein